MKTGKPLCLITATTVIKHRYILIVKVYTDNIMKFKLRKLLVCACVGICEKWHPIPGILGGTRHPRPGTRDSGPLR